MTKETEAVFRKALELSRVERAALLDGIAFSLETGETDLSPAWWDQIEARIDRIVRLRSP